MSTAPTTAEAAESFVIRIGKHAGQTLLAIDLASDRQYIRWIAQTWVRHDMAAIREAALAYLRFHPTTPRKRAPQMDRQLDQRLDWTMQYRRNM
jgi:hypothetical protein